MVDSAASKVRKGKEPIPVEVRKLKRKRQINTPKDTKFVKGAKGVVKSFKKAYKEGNVPTTVPWAIKKMGYDIKKTRQKSGPKGRPGSLIHKATSVKRSGANYSGD
tara:strand:+ start:514 stop:831 length:318 start_codon:yes stop_codon:yes gene_type:complete